MRLLSLATLYPAPSRPGFGRFVQTQLETLARQENWDVTVINPIGLPPLPQILCPAKYAPLRMIPAVETGAVTVHHPRFALIPGVSGRFNPSLIVRAVLPLARRLHTAQPFDMVDAQFFYPDGPAAAHIARALNLPLAIKARGGDILHWGTVPAAREQMLTAGAQARVLLTVSQALGRDMIAMGLPAERIRVHYTGLDHTRFYPRPRDEARAILAERLPALALPPDARLVVCVGNLIAIKGQALAIAAMSRLPGDVVLVLAGGGPDEAALRRQVETAGLGARVRFAGALGHDDLPLLLTAAEAMVLPSEREGLANAWIEALASGTPIVISDVGGAREVVSDPRTGCAVDRNPDAIAEALRAVLDANVPQAEVAAAAARFSWDANANELGKIYREVVK
ncbi:glycosyltransferase [Novosphingobium sp.]|uniref:glycosyltransferase n=1 Tax=Novosphingobium sp. TaxID=1874826 RepID=UPI003B52632D